jgi:hypothetical protein
MKGTGGVPDTILDGRHYSWEQEWNTYLLAMERAFYKTQNRRETKIVDSSMGDLFVSNIFLRQNKSLQLGSQRTEDSPAG